MLSLRQNLLSDMQAVVRMTSASGITCSTDFWQSNAKQSATLASDSESLADAGLKELILYDNSITQV